LIRILFSAGNGDWPEWEDPLRAALAHEGVAAELSAELPPGEADLLIWSPASAIRDLTSFPRLKAVFSLWAGVEKVPGLTTLTVPLARMVDPGMSAAMAEWVTGHVLRHHLGLDPVVRGLKGEWRGLPVPPPARSRQVGILGMGELGRAAGRMLSGIGFPVTGWARHGADSAFARIESGEAGLARVLGAAEILVLLLPLTGATRGLLDAARLQLCRRGQVIINAGRGGLIEEAALLAALDTGQIGHATLDVFAAEPLPPDHVFWRHPKITVSPHVAAATNPATAAPALVANLAGFLRGEGLKNRVDPDHGY
jgi:glyoxylate/hydroxypyruvate reductase A